LNITTLLGALTLITTISGGTWYVSENFARQDDLVVVASKADYALDKQMEYLLSQINRLDSKARAGKATEYDMEQIRYMREELKRLRALRRGG